MTLRFHDLAPSCGQVSEVPRVGRPSGLPQCPMLRAQPSKGSHSCQIVSTHSEPDHFTRLNEILPLPFVISAVDVPVIGDDANGRPPQHVS